MAGLLDGFDNRFDVERLDAAEVDDFCFDSVLALEDLGGLEGLSDAAGEGDDGEILSGALDFGFAELLRFSLVSLLPDVAQDVGLPYRNDKVVALRLLAHGEGETVEELVLEHTHRVRIANGSFEQTLGVLCGVWRNDF